MAKKRMTLDEVEAARRRAVTMFERFGDGESASEFSNMTAEAYAQHKGVEVINSNPNQHRRLTTMSLTRKEHVQREGYTRSIIEDALSSNTRADLRSTLEELSDIFAENAALVFNDDGTVEVETAGDDDEDEDDDDDDE